MLPCDRYGHWGPVRGVDTAADPTAGADPDSITVARYTHLDRGREIPECVLANVHSHSCTDRDLHLTPTWARHKAGLCSATPRPSNRVADPAYAGLRAPGNVRVSLEITGRLKTRS